MKRFIITLALLASCAHPKKPEESVSSLPDKEDLSALLEKRDAILERFKAFNVEAGYVVSRNPAGDIEHTGDSVLWTGLALTALPCEQGAAIYDQLRNDILRRGGLIARWAADPNPSHPSSRDQVRGVMLALVSRAKRCGDIESAREVWRTHMRYVADNNGGLFPGANPGYQVTDAFMWPWSVVGEYLGIQPATGSKFVFEAAMSSTAAAILVQKSAGYPIHLATLDAILAYEVGKPISKLGYEALCAASSGADLGLTEWYCRRKTALELLTAWKQDEYEYRWQRAAWETPDGDGHTTPGVDFILLYSLASRQ